MEHDTGTGLRTRSKAAPDWTVEESLILVNEIVAIEADCRGTLSSFQKWKIIVQNCNALDVNRNLNQCRRKWDSLLSDYRKIKHSGATKASFNCELLKLIERYVREHEGGYDTELDSDSDSDSDPEEPPLPPAAVVQFGSDNQKAKVLSSQKHSVEVKPKPIGHPMKSKVMEVEECSSEKRVDHHTNTVSRASHEQTMAEKLRENAELIEAIVNSTNGNYDLTRINGDKIIIYLSNLAVTLDELCELQTDSVM